ncbi:G-type lectin S-receptor-like serine/threonine-protein kinase SD2-5 [Camellia lanceoleosa]|uniref:G-type lectin S-receptor-like serine/threonine-protein kinase SD2-5 n=1 Tax=Camellia lanceoleosa TaxID=1840588 RepID=A0ACC0H4F8_9ERIC|nr:G-type lectin S-receptor-like serine/threonine-protein kinase SD2-5 [Camellia lanceoleosa]
MMCGFYCLSTQQTQPSSCLFGVAIFQNTSYLYSDIFPLINAPQLVWSANRDRPVQINATLQLTRDGDLRLEDADGTFVWSTNTSAKSVFGMKVTELGNLVLFDRNNATVWQSFDHPTDSLLVGQTLFPGQNLTSTTSSSNLTPRLYSLTVPDNNTLVAYVESNPPLPYFQSYLDVTYLKFENESFLGQKIPVASSLSAQFIRLEPDGHLKAYEWVGSNWNAVADLMTSDIGDCGYPMVCGRYDICSSNGQCSCLEEAIGNSTFRQINYTQPSLGCSLVTPISCDHSQYHTLLELKNTSYFYFNSLNPFNSNNDYLVKNISLEDCKKSCFKNCSCKAAMFAYTGCFLLSEVFSLMNNEGRYQNVAVFLKVQKSPAAEYPTPLPTDSPQKKSRHVKIILGSSIAAFFGVFFVIAFCLFLIRNKGESEELDEFYIDQLPGMPTRFSYEELRVMTSNFDNKLGEGGFGSVFQGTLCDGTNVAVKHLNGFGQVKKSFLAEVETIGTTHHVNLVRLIGFCAEKSYRLLVYEYMSKGSLDTWIFQRHQELTLGWQSRKKIIMDIAKGLTYLHEECRQKIFHLDIKPQNILLDECFNAKISDFGLSKLIDKDQSQVVTMMRGTPGYLAPEWLSSIITEKVDVYSFGVVVLEMLCGRKNLDRSQPEEDMHLLGLFKRKAEEEQLLDIVDKYNDDMQTNRAEVVEMMRVAVWCLQSDFSRRPSMSVVVKVLEGSVEVENNLDYSFTTPVVPRAIAVADHQVNAIGAATALLASTLSGPR